MFGDQQIEEEKEPTNPEAETPIDPRNFQEGIGFVDVMGFKLINVRQGESWQNLWMRYATDKDHKSEFTSGKDSRYYKFERAKQGKPKSGIHKAGKFDKHKFSLDKLKEERRKRFQQD